MTTLAQLVTRCQIYLQDETAEAWPQAQVETQLRETIAQLGRQQLLGEVRWQQGMAGVPEYLFPATTVEFAEVLYDGRSLRMVQEDALTRLRRDWDRAEGDPQYYTTPLEPSETVRLIPVPVSTGSPTLVDPPQPLAGTVEGNLVAFLWSNPDTAGATAFPLQEVLEDIVVFQTVAALTGQDGEFHDKTKGQSFAAIAQLLLQALLGGTT